MKVLTRYLLRSHAGPLLFAFVALTSFMLINTLARTMADLAGKGLDRRVLLEFFALYLPATVALTLPMSVLVAVLHTFSRMAEDRELFALKASGVDLRRMVLPLLAVAGGIAGGMLWFNNRVLPAANHRLATLMLDVAETTPLLTLEPQVMNSIPVQRGAGRVYLRAGRIDQGGNRLYDVTIYDVTNPDASRTVYADSGRVAVTPEGTDMVLTLFDGTLHEVQLSQPENFQRAGFQRQVMRLAGVRDAMARTAESGVHGDRDMSTAMMRDTIASLRTALHRAVVGGGGAPPGSDPGATAAAQAAHREYLRAAIRAYEVEIQKRLSVAAATLVFVLIGVPLAVRFPTGGIGMVITASLSIFAVYWIGLHAGEVLGNRGVVPPWVGMWAANALFALAGVTALARLGREPGSGRDAGWDKPADWMRRRRHRRNGTVLVNTTAQDS